MLKTLSIVQGDSYFVRIALLKDGQPWPIAGWKFWFTVKRAAADLDAAAIAQKSTAAGTILPQGPTAAYVIGAPVDTKEQEVGRCEYDIQGESPEGDIYTLERGNVLIKSEITRAV